MDYWLAGVQRRQALGVAQETCCQGQHTYVHAQQILTELGQHMRGTRFRRLSQELEAHAAAQRGAIVWQMHAWCALLHQLAQRLFTLKRSLCQ